MPMPMPPPPGKFNSNSYCHPDMPSAMYMSGFQAMSSDQACLALWFKAWVVDSHAKFVISCLVVSLLCIAVEMLMWLNREWLTAKTVTQRFGVRGHQVFLWLVYLMQVTLGYFVMLAAMSYHWGIFLSVMLGMSVGHMIFNGPTVSLEDDADGTEDDNDDAYTKYQPSQSVNKSQGGFVTQVRVTKKSHSRSQRSSFEYYPPGTDIQRAETTEAGIPMASSHSRANSVW